MTDRAHGKVECLVHASRPATSGRQHVLRAAIMEEKILGEELVGLVDSGHGVEHGTRWRLPQVLNPDEDEA